MPSEQGIKKVLVADDDPDIRRLARTMLARHGYEVIEAGDGDEIVKLALQHKANLDYFKQESMVVFSFVKLFSEEVKAAMGTVHDCPHHDNIQSILEVYPLSVYVKEKYCDKCSFKNQCTRFEINGA